MINLSFRRYADRRIVNKSLVQKIGDQEMDRKAFLKYTGLLLASVVGLRGIISLLTVSDPRQSTIDNKQTSKGFGSGKYGV